ncbi:MAG: beta-N-acetylglucosaminidase domain-containing protein [Candidatus Pristimantibacillus sp.]
MSKRLISLMVSLFIAASAFYGMGTAKVEASSSGAVSANKEYEIYPIPHHQIYSGTEFIISDEVNLVFEDEIDDSTRNFMNKILDSKSIQVSMSQAIVADKTNILIGTKASAGIVDDYFEANIAYDASIFGEEDAYVLAIDKELEAKGAIAVLGASTDAAYYALATLKMIFDQMAGNEILSVKFEDYADAKWRGFIEGFYGFPWSHEDRISLMRFGGQIKMNSYIFAPKDDQYHNSAWRTLYPAAELAKVKELVDVGHESKTQFIWAIHPGFSMINWNNYEVELQTLLTKLDQLYNVGVRQFGLFMDDISTSQSLTDREKHVRLVTDVANWVSSKGDVKSLIYCPPFYNEAWTGESGKPYLQALRAVPDNVEIMWTGKDVIGSVNQIDNQWVKNEIGRDPYIWFNYPVNGYKKNRLLLGQVEMLKQGTDNFSGIVSNPLEQAELSKVALFGVADYTWNVDGFDKQQSWVDSFKYIAPEVASEYNMIAYHMSDPSPNGRGVVFNESENLKVKLDSFLSTYSNGASITSLGSELVTEFDRLLDAIQGFREKIDNPSLMEEINPWLSCLNLVVLSDKYAVQSVMALQNNDQNGAWEALAKATKAMSESQKFTRDVIGDKPIIVEAGSKRLVPFAHSLIQKLDAEIYSSLDPAFISPLAISSYGSPSALKNIVDGNPATYFYNQTIQKNGDWYGVDFGKSIKVNNIEIIQGRTDTDQDRFQRGILEYSLDGQSWTAIGEERSGYRIIERGLDVNARSIRYRLTHAGIPGGKPDLWTAVREFTVNAGKDKAAVYSNLPELIDVSVESSESGAGLSQVSAITLESSQYIGIKLSSIENIAGITLNHSNNDAELESSENGVEWQLVSPGSSYYPSAAYFRLINKGEQAITFDLTTLQVSFQKFVDPVVTHNYEGIYEGALAGVYDEKVDAKVWFRGRQTPGRFVQVDLGGVVNVKNAAVVINDGEADYFRQGDLQLSVGGTSWETIHTFSNPGDRSLNFPEHTAPYRYKRVQVENKPARYIRLYTTVDRAGWLALNEIIVNEGIEKPGSESPVIQAQPQGDSGNEPVYAADQQLSTFYTPQGTPQPGSLHYKVFKHTELSQMIVLQSPTAISDATISIRDEQGWHQAGQLSQAYNVIDTMNYSHVLEMKLEWSGTVKPAIYEIIPIQRESEVVQPEEQSTVLTAPALVAGGGSFDVQFGLSNVTQSVYAQDIMIHYNPLAMEFIAAKSLKDGVNLLTVNDEIPGQIRLIVVSEGADHAVTGDAQLLELSFKAKMLTEQTTATLSVSKAVLADEEGTETEASVSSVQIQVKPEVGIVGDVNQDNKITIGDLALVAANYGKDSSNADWQQVKNADVNRDGVIDLEDLVLVARKIVE